MGLGALAWGVGTRQGNVLLSMDVSASGEWILFSICDSIASWTCFMTEAGV